MSIIPERKVSEGSLFSFFLQETSVRIPASAINNILNNRLISIIRQIFRKKV